MRDLHEVAGLPLLSSDPDEDKPLTKDDTRGGICVGVSGGVGRPKRSSLNIETSLKNGPGGERGALCEIGCMIVFRVSNC